MLKMIVSGGQTGADQAAWRAAKKAGIPTSGFMPLGFLTEEGPRPEFTRLYGAKEHPKHGYPPRTRENVFSCDATLFLGDDSSKGGMLTRRACKEAHVPFWSVFFHEDGPGICAENLAFAIKVFKVEVLNVAGNRESSNPGIGKRVEEYLGEVFAHLKQLETGFQ